MIESWHCDYQYQTVSGTLDSHPTPLSSDCFITASSSATTTAGATYLNGFSYGEALIAFFLLLILIILFFKVAIDRSLGVKTQNRENYN